MCHPLHFTCSSTPGIVVHSTPNLCRPAPARVLWSLHLVQYNFSHMSYIFSIFVEEDKTSHTHPMFSTNFSAALYCLASHYLKPARIGCSPPFRRAPRDRYVRGTWTTNIFQHCPNILDLSLPSFQCVFSSFEHHPVQRREVQAWFAVVYHPRLLVVLEEDRPCLCFFFFFLLTSFVLSRPSRH